MKPGSNFLFHFVDILDSKIFTEDMLDIFYNAIKKIRPGKKNLRQIILNKPLCNSSEYVTLDHETSHKGPISQNWDLYIMWKLNK